MRTLGETRFHLLMGVLTAGSLFVDRAIEAVLPTWNPPEVHLTTLVLGLVWVGAFTAYQARRHDDARRVLDDRLDRLQRRVDALESEARDKLPPGTPTHW